MTPLDLPKPRIAIIGGGAAGFFAAIQTKSNYPHAQVVLYEKSKKLLAKVKVSGGGRCNVTNGETSISALVKAYPRGAKLMKRGLRTFNTSDIRTWFEERGVALKLEPDGRVFPVSDSSQTVIDCLMKEASHLGVGIQLSSNIKNILTEEYGLTLTMGDGLSQRYDNVIVATGGSPKISGFEWLLQLGHKIEPPVPSLFTFNMPSESITGLMGVVAPEVTVSVQGTKLKSTGPLLITHWGMSGPAVLKLSAFGARILSECHYQFNIQVNWVNIVNNEIVLAELKRIAIDHPKKLLTSLRPYHLPDRLWKYLFLKSAIPADRRWEDLGKKGFNKLVTLLTNDVYKVSGKTTFKEEFVTCGGVSLSSIHLDTMQSKVVPRLFFAGEVLDIDGVTGGYNFQAAWTTAFIAAKLGGSNL